MFAPRRGATFQPGVKPREFGRNVFYPCLAAVEPAAGRCPASRRFSPGYHVAPLRGARSLSNHVLIVVVVVIACRGVVRSLLDIQSFFCFFNLTPMGWHRAIHYQNHLILFRIRRAGSHTGRSSTIVSHVLSYRAESSLPSVRRRMRQGPEFRPQRRKSAGSTHIRAASRKAIKLIPRLGGTPRPTCCWHFFDW